MLNCKLCDYYHAVSGESFPGMNLGLCDFADMLFIEDAENLNIEYPCSKIEYPAYLAKKPAVRIDPVSVTKYVKPELYRQLKECGVSMLKFPEGIIVKCFTEHLENEKAGKCHTRKVQSVGKSNA